MDPVERVTLSFPANRKYLGLVGNLMREIQRHVPNLPDAAGYNVQLAVDEAVVNVISHAYRNDPQGRVELTIEIHRSKLVIQIRDWGESYDPNKIQEPDFGQPQERGYGLYLIRKLMDQVSYVASAEQGNCATLTKEL